MRKSRIFVNKGLDYFCSDNQSATKQLNTLQIKCFLNTALAAFDRGSNAMSSHFYLEGELCSDKYCSRERWTVDISGIAVWALVEVLLVCVEDVLHTSVNLKAD